MEQAEKYLAKAQAIQPTAPAVMSMSIMFWMRTGQFERSSQLLKSMFQKNIVDYDLIYAAYITGARTHDWPLMIQALQLRIQHWPKEAIDGWLKLGDIYAQKAEVRDDSKALQAYRSAIEATPAANRNQTLEKIPPAYRSQLKVTP